MSRRRLMNCFGKAKGSATSISAATPKACTGWGRRRTWSVFSVCRSRARPYLSEGTEKNGFQPGCPFVERREECPVAGPRLGRERSSPERFVPGHPGQQRLNGPDGGDRP